MRNGMNTLLNVIWLLFGGIWLALAYLIAGVIGCLLIVTIPAGVASLRMAKYVFWPFGSVVVNKPNKSSAAVVMNMIWFVTVGWFLALMHVVTALTQAITVVGIAHAIVNLKMIHVSVFPFGKRIVPRGAAGFDALGLEH